MFVNFIRFNCCVRPCFALFWVQMDQRVYKKRFLASHTLECVLELKIKIYCSTESGQMLFCAYYTFAVGSNRWKENIHNQR